MIPPFMATIGGKVAASLGLVVVLGLGYYIWKDRQQSIGEARAEARQAAQLLEQQQEATGQFIVQEALKLRNVERTMGEKDRLNEQLRKSYQQVVRLANERPTQPDDSVIPAIEIPEEPDEQACLVRPALVRAVNDMAGVLNQTAEGRASSPSGATSQPALPGS